MLQADDGRAHAFGDRLPTVDLGWSLAFLPAPAGRVWLVNGDSWDPAGDLRVRQVDVSGPPHRTSDARAGEPHPGGGAGRPRAARG